MDRVCFCFLRPHLSSLAKPALCAALAVGMLTAGQAQALVVKVEGQYWDVTTFTGSYNDNKSKFNTLANGGVMPWWVTTPPVSSGGASESEAQFIIQFVKAVNTKLGFPNLHGNLPFLELRPPGFAYNYRDLGVRGGEVLAWQSAFTSSADPIGGADPFPTSSFKTYTWAQATRAGLPPPSVPGPLPILGVGAAFGYSRKLRKRIKNAKPEVINTTAV